MLALGGVIPELQYLARFLASVPPGAEAGHFRSTLLRLDLTGIEQVVVKAGGQTRPIADTLTSSLVAVQDAYATKQNQALQVGAASGLLANDSGIGLNIFAQTVPTARGGSVTEAADGSFTYRPPQDLVGTDSFNYIEQDWLGRRALGVAIVNVASTAANQPPVAVADNYSMRPNQTLTVAAANGLLANDSDPNGDKLTVASVDTSNLAGQLTVAADGSLVYAPPNGFVGPAFFNYFVTDGVNTTQGLAEIDVLNDPPTVVNDSYSILHGRTLTVSAASGLLANDSDPNGDKLTVFSVDTTSLQGSVAVSSDGGFTFTPSAGFAGDKTFKYTATDGFAKVQGFATLHVLNDPPVSVDHSYTLRPDQTLLVTSPGLLQGDSDPNGDPISVSQVDTTGLVGALTVSFDGHFSYTPPAGFAGDTSFKYFVYDGFTTSEANVVLHVVNDPPVAVDHSYTLRPDETLLVTSPGLLQGDSDPNGGPISISQVDTTGLVGALTVSFDGHFTYTPPAGFAGDTSFKYFVYDGFTTSEANVVLHVVNDPPVAVDHSYCRLRRSRPGKTE